MNKKSGFYFTYNLEQVKVTRKVTVNFKDKTVPEVLDELFAKENIHYVINDKHIALYKGNDKQVVLQAKKDIKGVVTDKNGEPIPGANIIEKGNPTNGTITDVDGNYTLSVSGNSVLVASYIGYNRIEIQVKNRSVVDITLSEDTQALEEVVVVGYSTQKKVNLTGSVAAVKVDEKIASRSITNVSSSLSGLVPGLVVSQTTGFIQYHPDSCVFRNPDKVLCGFRFLNRSWPVFISQEQLAISQITITPFCLLFLFYLKFQFVFILLFALIPILRVDDKRYEVGILFESRLSIVSQNG